VAGIAVACCLLISVWEGEGERVSVNEVRMERGLTCMAGSPVKVYLTCEQRQDPVDMMDACFLGVDWDSAVQDSKKKHRFLYNIEDR
jgi:hypothetical protein